MTTMTNNNKKNKPTMSFYSATAAAAAVVLGVLLLIQSEGCHAAMSDECKNETSVLDNNYALQTELGMLMKNFDEQVSANDACTAESLSSYDCNITYAGNATKYEELCVGGGGVIHYDTVNVNCSILFGTTNIPICVGGSCATEDLVHEDINNTEFEKFKDSLRGDGCAVDGVSGATTAAAVGFFGIVAAVSSFVAALL